MGRQGHYERRGDVEEWVWDDPAPTPAPAPAPKGYDRMSKAELIAAAKGHGIEDVSGMSKAELLEALGA